MKDGRVCAHLTESTKRTSGKDLSELKLSEQDIQDIHEPPMVKPLKKYDRYSSGMEVKQALDYGASAFDMVSEDSKDILLFSQSCLKDLYAHAETGFLPSFFMPDMNVLNHYKFASRQTRIMEILRHIYSKLNLI